MTRKRTREQRNAVPASPATRRPSPKKTPSGGSHLSHRAASAPVSSNSYHTASGRLRANVRDTANSGGRRVRQKTETPQVCSPQSFNIIINVAHDRGVSVEKAKAEIMAVHKTGGISATKAFLLAAGIPSGLVLAPGAVKMVVYCAAFATGKAMAYFGV